MKKSAQQIQDELAALTQELLAALEAEAAPKVGIVSQSGGSTGGFTIHFGSDTQFDLVGGKLTITDVDGDEVTLDLNPVLPATWPRTETSFVYNGIARKGIVVGLQDGRFTTLVEVLETWNERDGDQDEPTYKLFSSDQIIRSYREKA